MSTLKLNHEGHTTVITVDNPPANTWTPDSLHELEQIVLSLNSDKGNYALIITGAGEKFFSAGADLKRFQGTDKNTCIDFSSAFGSAFEVLSEYQGVSIAAINGFAMGGGLEVALACDIRIAEQQAMLALPECSVGLLPCGLGTQQLSWLIGEQWAKRMILLGEKIDTDKALSIGLISEIIEPGKALIHALGLSKKLDTQSPIAIKKCKSLIMAARSQNIKNNYLREREEFIALWDTLDRQEGVNAFLEKREPEWKNK